MWVEHSTLTKDIGKTLKKLFNCKIIEDKSIKNLKNYKIKHILKKVKIYL